MSTFTVHPRHVGPTLVLEVAGEWDLADRAAFERHAERVIAAPPPLAVVDLRALDFIGSVGLHACAGLAAAALVDGWQVAFVRGGDVVQRAFAAVGLAERLRFVDDPNEALHLAG